VEDRLLPVNGLLGLVTPHDVNQPLLRDGGFELVGLEIPVAVGSGKVVIDVLLINQEHSVLLACEAKSGANVEAPQAEKYRDLDANTVVQAASVTLRKPVKPSVIAVYACLCEHVARIRRGLADVKLSCPIIGVCRDHLIFDVPQDAPTVIHEALPNPSLSLVGPPPRLIEFDQDSPADAVLPAVRAQLVKALALRRQRVSVQWLAEAATPYLTFYGRNAKQRLVKTIGEAARMVSESDNATFEYHGPRPNDADCGFVRLLRTPEDNDPQGRTQAYQALARGSHVRRRRTRQHDPDQLDLLQELAQGDDEDVEDDGEGTL